MASYNAFSDAVPMKDPLEAFEFVEGSAYHAQPVWSGSTVPRGQLREVHRAQPADGPSWAVYAGLFALGFYAISALFG